MPRARQLASWVAGWSKGIHSWQPPVQLHPALPRAGAQLVQPLLPRPLAHVVPLLQPGSSGSGSSTTLDTQPSICSLIEIFSSICLAIPPPRTALPGTALCCPWYDVPCYQVSCTPHFLRHSMHSSAAVRPHLQRLAPLLLCGLPPPLVVLDGLCHPAGSTHTHTPRHTHTAADRLSKAPAFISPDRSLACTASSTAPVCTLPAVAALSPAGAPTCGVAAPPRAGLSNPSRNHPTQSPRVP